MLASQYNCVGYLYPSDYVQALTVRNLKKEQNAAKSSLSDRHAAVQEASKEGSKRANKLQIERLAVICSNDV